MMLNHYLPLFCAACRSYVLVHKDANLTLPWRIALLADPLCEGCPPVGYPTEKTRCRTCPRRHNTPAPSHAYCFCSDACQAKGPARPEGERVVAFLELQRTKGLLVRKGAEDALMGFLTPVSDHPEYLDGHATGMGFRKVAEDMVKPNMISRKLP